MLLALGRKHQIFRCINFIVMAVAILGASAGLSNVYDSVSIPIGTKIFQSNSICHNKRSFFHVALSQKATPRCSVTNSSDTVEIGTDTLLAELSALPYLVEVTKKTSVHEDFWTTGVNFAKSTYGFDSIHPLVGVDLSGKSDPTAFAMVFEGVSSPASLADIIAGPEVDHQLPQSNWSLHQDAMVISIRGTHHGHSILNTNLRFKNTYHPLPGFGKVHDGFMQYSNALLRSPYRGKVSFLDYMRTSHGYQKPIFLTGHSLGGAAAVYIASLLESEGFNVFRVATFGAPRLGDSDFVERYNNSLFDRTVQYRNGRDFVPLLPMKSLGYEDAGRIYWIDFSGNLRESGEYPYVDLSLLRMDKFLIALAHHAHILHLPGYADRLRSLYLQSTQCEPTSLPLPREWKRDTIASRIIDLIGVGK